MDVVDKKQISASKEKQAIKRLGLLKEFEKFCGYYLRLHHEGTRAEAMAKFATEKRISVGSRRRQCFCSRIRRPR